MNAYSTLRKLFGKGRKSKQHPFVQQGTEYWDSMYEEGKYERLRHTDQVARYSVIVGYIQFFKDNCKILDIGCGEGLLKTRLYNSLYSRYLGVDVSPVAIRMASQHEDNKSEFRIGAMENVNIDEQFDIIVFNDSLYCVNSQSVSCTAMKKISN